MEMLYRKHTIIMMLCFLFGGFAIISYGTQVYSALWEPSLMSSLRGETENFSNFPTPNETNFSGFRERQVIQNPAGIIFSPISVALLLTGIVSIVGGFSIWDLTREKEIKSAKKVLLDSFLMPEEKKVVEEIEKHGGAIKQNELAKNTGFSRVKIHRIIKNLESKNLIVKNEYGMTNKIVLKK